MEHSSFFFKYKLFKNLADGTCQSQDIWNFLSQLQTPKENLVMEGTITVGVPQQKPWST